MLVTTIGVVNIHQEQVLRTGLHTPGGHGAPACVRAFVGMFPSFPLCKKTDSVPTLLDWCPREGLRGRQEVTMTSFSFIFPGLFPPLMTLGSAAHLPPPCPPAARSPAPHTHPHPPPPESGHHLVALCRPRPGLAKPLPAPLCLSFPRPLRTTTAPPQLTARKRRLKPQPASAPQPAKPISSPELSLLALGTQRSVRRRFNHYYGSCTATLGRSTRVDGRELT